MPGPLPKSAATRQRKGGTAAILTDQQDALGYTPLPERTEEGSATPWHPMTVAWWADLWRSPMVAEFTQSDIHGLVQLAVLMDAFWTAPSPIAAKDFAAEIRLQSQRYGLSPLDRRRLQWEVRKVEGQKPAAPAPAATPTERRSRLHILGESKAG